MSGGDGLDGVRRDVAAARGLDERALPFIAGETVDEIEASADKFVTLVGRRETSSSGPSGDLFAGVAQHQAARKQALVDLFVGRPAEQPRDESGRYASTSFDGGARQPAPPPPPNHDEWLGEVLRHRRADAGANF